MSDLDHTSLDRILPPSSGSADWADVLRRAGRGRERRGRRLVGVVAALLVLVVGTASAFGVRDLFANQPHAQRSFYQERELYHPIRVHEGRRRRQNGGVADPS